MISYMPNLISVTGAASSSSQQPMRPLDSEMNEHGVMGFVMPENQASQSGLVKTISSQPAAISSIPEHLMAELKQHPQLLNTLNDQITLAPKSDIGTAADLSNLASAQAKPLSPELSALLASLHKQAGNMSANHTDMNARFNPQASVLSMQGTQSSLPAQNGLSSNSIAQNSLQTTAEAPMSVATTVSGQAHFQPAVINVTDAANAELDSINQVINQLTQTNTKGQSVSQWGPVSVSQSAPMLQQANEMMSPLRDQLRFQIDQQIKSAELRLDPPELGKVELNIRLDGDRLHVQMHAANPAVRDALLMGLDRLRMELAMDHGGQIDVDLGQSQPEQQAQHQQAPQIHNNNIEFQSSEQNQATELTQQDQVDLLA